MQRAQRLLGKDADRVLLGDFFKQLFPQSFDLVYERTFLCALSPALRKSYASRIKELLLPGGRLVGFFFYGSESDLTAPPYPLDLEEGKELFCNFRLVEDQPVTDSLALFEGKERWQHWEKV